MPDATPKPHLLFVTGRLAEPALRRVLTDLAPKAGFSAEIAVLPISVAALLTTDWVARHLTVPPGVQRISARFACRWSSSCGGWWSARAT